MERSKEEAIPESAEVCSEAEDFPETSVDIPELRDRIIRIVGNQALEMIRASISQVKDGQYIPMKYLFEMIGLFPATVSRETTEKGSLAEILLENLGVCGEQVSGDGNGKTEVMKDSLLPAKEATSNAVE